MKHEVLDDTVHRYNVICIEFCGIEQQAVLRCISSSVLLLVIQVSQYASSVCNQKQLHVNRPTDATIIDIIELCF